MFARFGGLISLSLAACALLLASCSTATPPSALETSTTTKPYGSLVVSGNFHNGHWAAAKGPAMRSGNTFIQLGSGTFDSLVELSPEGQARPGLAERWEISMDGKTHTFYLRKGVKFQDGSDLTAADVKFSIDNMLRPEVEADDAPVWRAAVASVELKGDHTVVLNMKQPQFELLKGAGELSGVAAVMPKKYIEEKGFDYFMRNPIGSGPWKIVDLSANSRLELEAVDSHWRATPRFKNVTFVNVREEATKVAMLKTGELDIADVSPDSAAGLKAAGIRILRHYGGGQTAGYFFYDLDNPSKYALGDIRVRKALSLAVDRQELADKIFMGYAQPSALFYAPRTAYFYDPNVLKPDPFDPEQAKKLIAEAGYSNGFTIKLWDDTAYGTLGNTVNQAYTGYWRKLGVNSELVAIEHATVIAKWRPSISPDLYNSIFTNVSAGGALQFERMVTMYHSVKGSAKNHRNLKLNELIDKVPMTLDPAEKKRIAIEAAVLAKNEYNTFVSLDFDILYALGPKVGNMTPIKGVTSLGPVFETITHAK